MATSMQENIERNFIKGVLILLVIADHNDFMRALFKSEFKPLTLHVFGFFFLAMHSDRSMRGSIRRFFTDRLVRYGVPFLLFYAGYAFMYHMLGMRHGVGTLPELATDIAAGALIGSFALVKQGAGAAFLWFLPTLFGFVLTSHLFAQLKPPYRAPAFCVACIAHLFIGALPPVASVYSPLGLMVAIYMLPIALLCSRAEQYGATRATPFSVSMLLGFASAVTYAYLVAAGATIEIGTLEVPVLHHNWEVLIAHDVSVLTGFLFLLSLARQPLAGTGFLCDVGQHSLLIYLMHPAVFFIVRILTESVMPSLVPAGDRSPAIIAFALCSIMLTAYLSLCAARIVSRIPVLRQLATPRNADDWLSGAEKLFRRSKFS